MVRTRVGFTGGSTEFPTYTDLADHTETLEVDFDPTVTSYSAILDLFWQWHDPCRPLSKQYMSVIWYHSEEQRKQAEASVAKQKDRQPKPVLTQILPAQTFCPAEDYHQKYMLRCNKTVFDAMGLNDQDVVRSYAACRVNGYCGNFGTLESFNKECDGVGYTDQQLDIIRAAIHDPNILERPPIK